MSHLLKILREFGPVNYGGQIPRHLTPQRIHAQAKGQVQPEKYDGMVCCQIITLTDVQLKTTLDFLTDKNLHE